MTEWQRIDTAPKDRLLLVGFFNERGKWRSAHAQYRVDLPQHDDADEDEEPAPAGWYEGSLEAEMLWMIRPTHWMPLPAPPNEWEARLALNRALTEECERLYDANDDTTGKT